VSVIVSRSEDTLRPAVSEYVRFVNVIAGFVVQPALVVRVAGRAV